METSNQTPYLQLHSDIDSVQQSLQNISQQLKEFEQAPPSYSADGSPSERAQSLSEFLQITHQLNSDMELDTFLKKVIDLSIKFLNADCGYLLLYNDEGRLETEIARHRELRDLQPNEYELSRTALRKVILTGLPLFIPDADLSETDHRRQDYSYSIMCLPLGRRRDDRFHEKRLYKTPTADQLLGILYLERVRNEQGSFQPANFDLIQGLANQASLVLINTLLYKRMHIDALTGLYLRPYLNDYLENELRLCQQIDGVLAVLMMDIDFFKGVNDRFGHQMGDVVLQETAKLLAKKLRSSDICARYGGEEFAIVLPSTNLAQAQIVAEKLRGAMESFPFTCGRMTLSVGVSAYPDHVAHLPMDAQAEKLLKFADQALYHSKQTGRNRFTVWSEATMNLREFLDPATGILSGDPIRDHRNVQLLIEVIEATSKTFDLEKLYIHIVDMILQITGTENGFLLLINPANHALDVHVARTNKGENIPSNHRSLNTNVLHKALEKNKPGFFKKTTSPDDTPEPTAGQTASVLCIPLQIRERQFGIIYLESALGLRQFVKAELSFFHALSHQLANAIEHVRLHEDAIVREKLKRDLVVASQIQMGLLPQEIPFVKGLSLTGQMRPAAQVGGDYYDFILSEDGKRFYFAIGDVAGKGVVASLLMVQARSMLHSLLRRESSTLNVLIQMNHQMYKDILAGGEPLFMSFLLFCWDIEMRQLTYTSAGHEHILVFQHKSRTCQKIKSGGLGLGIVPNIEPYLTESLLKIEPNDAILLYTDGITEHRSTTGEMFGLSSLQNILVETGHQEPQQIQKEIFRRFELHGNHAEPEDDITCVVAKQVDDRDQI